MAASGGQMSNMELLQQAALLKWLSSQSEEDRGLLAALTRFRVARDLFGRLTGQDQVDAYRRECIMSVAEFVREKPRASQADINAHVEKCVVLFAARVKAAEAAPLF